MKDDLRSQLEQAFEAAESASNEEKQVQEPAQKQDVADAPVDDAVSLAKETPAAAVKDEKEIAEPEKAKQENDAGKESKSSDDEEESDFVLGKDRRLSYLSGWSPEAKKAYNELPKSVKEAIHKREEEISRGFRNYSEKVAEYGQYDKIFAPYQNELKLAGYTPVSYTEKMLAVSDLLEKDPIRGIAWIANEYGVDLQQLLAGARAQQPHLPQQHQQPGAINRDPNVERLQRQVNGLHQYISSTIERSAAQEIQAVASDPKNIYYENVKSDMASLIQAGLAVSAQDAYDKACNLNPEIRAIMQEDQKKRIASQYEQSASLQRAKAASQNLRSAPTPGGPTSAQIDLSNLEPRELLLDAYERFSKAS